MKNLTIADKWVNECGIFFPIDGNTQLHQSIGNGVFELYQGTGQDKRIGLKKLYDKFEFPYKIYDLGCDSLMETIKKTWESDEFINGDKNLGVIFHGTRGTGKTMCSRILCNLIGIPVILINDIKEGMINFLQSLSFEAIILIDEAEKIFKKGEDDEILLKIVDGAYNKARKLYILTVNRLDINENMLGRPGRIRYVKHFGNLSEKAVNDYIADNLKVPGMEGKIKELIDLLEISTIDILKNIVEEVNIHGDITENSCLNIPKARYIFDIFTFRTDLSENQIQEIKALFSKIGNNLDTWLNEKRSGDNTTNEDWLYDEYGGYSQTMSSQYSVPWKGCETNMGEVVENIDDLGFFVVKETYSGYDRLCKIIKQRSNPSLYRGGLV